MKRREFIKNASVTVATAAGFVALLRRSSGTAVAGQPPLRPPGALDEDGFLSRCIRCLRCSDACPNHAILPLTDAPAIGAQSTPYIKPRRQACMLCGGVEGAYLKCTEACPTGALGRIPKTPESIRDNTDMGVAEIDLALCYSYNNWSCGACFRACPFPGEAMTLGMWERPEIIADVCVGCGLCERACIRYPQAVRVKPRSAV